MKAFLLAAGEGTRLQPLTNELPKCLVPLGGTPLLGIWLELCRRHGIDEVLINLHWKAEQVRQYVQTDPRNTKVRFFHEERLLGTAGTVAANYDWVAGETCFWILYADIVSTVNLTHMLQFHRNRRAEFTMGIVPVDDPQQCGIAVLNEQEVIVDFEEKPRSPKSNWGFGGLFLAGPTLFGEIPRGVPADFGFHVFRKLAGRMHGYLIREYLTDVGTMEPGLFERRRLSF